MKKQILLLFILLTMGHLLIAQQTMPIIKAHSKLVDIRDGEFFSKGNWTISPELKPDVYTANKSKKPKKVTFITDIDSLSFTIEPNKRYDFKILLNNQDTAWTQIYMPDYLLTLKKAEKFDNQDKKQILPFTYQSKDNPNLLALRKGFNLDSIAGTGTDISQILNLMHWIHNLIPHDGNHENPTIKNAMSLITICKKDNRGLNCRGLSTVLNECYLAMGFKSRHITCLPKDSTDTECHVINLVYAPSLKKWIWVDATWDAYVMDEKGELLGVEEVRERLINGKMLILNPDANWNHKESANKEHYLYNYMAKNLYRLECPISSEYDYETKAEGKMRIYNQLIPLDYNEMIVKNPSKTIMEHFTNNPSVFWAKPE
jgi:hypothetical protein